MPQCKSDQNIMPIEKLISEIDKLKYSDSTCCYSTCSVRPITSHTMSENYLYKLNRDLTKILTFQPQISPILNKKNPNLMKKIDKKEFSTFVGFCKSHDHDLFKPIDLFDGEINNEKAALIHYRNICYGINHIKTQLLRLQHICNQNYTDDELANAESNKLTMIYQKKNNQFENRLNYCLNEHLKRKKQLENMINFSNFDEIDFQILTLNFDNPIFCGRSTYLLHKDNDFFKFHGYSYMPWLTYMTLLTNNSNTLVFCWLKNEGKHVSLPRTLLKNKDCNQIIDGLVYACSDAFALDESFYHKHPHIINPIIKKFRSY